MLQYQEIMLQYFFSVLLYQELRYHHK